MKISLKQFVTYAVALSITAVAFADDLADFKKWQAKDAPNAVKAMESKNMAYFEGICAPNFTYTEGGGKTLKKKEALAGLKMMMDGAETIKYKFKHTSFKAIRGSIVVDLLNEYTMTMKPAPDKKKHVMWMRNKTRETWVKSGGKWLLKNITDVGVPETKMDGKPMPAGAMGGG